jgi:hypothetical protein
VKQTVERQIRNPKSETLNSALGIPLMSGIQKAGQILSTKLKTQILRPPEPGVSSLYFVFVSFFALRISKREFCQALRRLEPVSKIPPEQNYDASEVNEG